MKLSYRTFRLGKMVPLALILITLTAGVWTYIANQSLIHHQRPYFFPMYATLAKYDVTQALHKFEPADSNAGETARSVPVLLYHGILADSSDENVSLKLFTSQMIALKKAGYHTIGIQDYLDFMSHGKKLAPKSVLITFDDGRKDSFYPAEPVLEALNFKAVMYVITEASFAKPGSKYYQSKYYLSQSELLAMKKSGHWELQTHAAFGHFLIPIDAKGTQGHFYDNKMWLAGENRLETDQEFAKRILGDLQLAKSDLMAKVGTHSISFAFPFNEFGALTVNYPGSQSVLLNTLAHIFPINFYQVWPNKGSSQNFPQDGSNILDKRILINSAMTTDKLMQRLSNSDAKSLPYQIGTSHGEWLSTWGVLSWVNSNLQISPGKGENGASSFLDGARDWHNYQLKSTLQITGGEGKVMLRYIDDSNYASCTYMPDGIILETTIDGTSRTLGSAVATLPPDLSVTTRVQGNKMSCGVGSRMLLTKNLPDSLGYGSIGFQTWNKVQNVSQLEVSDVSVTSLP